MTSFLSTWVHGRSVFKNVSFEHFDFLFIIMCSDVEEVPFVLFPQHFA